MGLISRVSSRTYRFCQKYILTMGDQEEEIIDLHSMKVVELKAELKQRKLPVSGTKAELIDRLEKYMTEHEGVEAVDEDELDEPVGKVEKPKEVVAEKKADSPKAPAGLSLAEEDEEPAKPEKTKSDEGKNNPAQQDSVR